MALRELIVTSPDDTKIFWDRVYEAHRNKTPVNVIVQPAQDELSARRGNTERTRDFAFTVWGILNEPNLHADIHQDDGTAGYIEETDGKLVITMVES
jgi:hypothetical protein